MALVQKKIKKVYLGSTQVRPDIALYSTDITLATQDQSIQPTSISNNRCIDVSSDWCHILLSNETWPVYEYTLSAPRDLSSTITSQTANLKTKTYTDCVVYSEDGSYIYINNTDSGNGTGYSVIEQRQLSTPFDISTASSIVYSKTTNNGERFGGFQFYNNGLNLIGATRDGKILSWTLSTAWNISTLWNLTVQYQSVTWDSVANWFAISPDGMACYCVAEWMAQIQQFDTLYPYDFSQNTSTIRSASFGSYNFGVNVSPDWHYLFLATQNGTIYRYTFSLK